MNKVLTDKGWYAQIGKRALSEAEFEQLLVDNAESLWPDFYFAFFKVDVRSEEGVKRPDFVLVDRSFRHWWVVEVEMAHHSFDHHVMPQLLTFWKGNYTKMHADAVAGALPGLPEDRIEALVVGSQPSVHVVVDRPTKWESTLGHLGISLSVVEVYRSDHNQVVFRTSGSWITAPPVKEIYCRRDPVVPRALVVSDPNVIPDFGSSIEVVADGDVHLCDLVSVGGRVLLLPREGDLIPEGDSGVLRVDSVGSLTLVAD